MCARDIIDSLIKATDRLKEILDVANFILCEADMNEVEATAPHLWAEIRAELEQILLTTAARVDAQMTLTSPPPTQPPQTLECIVCLDALPTVVLSPCHHILCPVCALRVQACPLCRKVIYGRKRIFYDG